MKLQNSFRFFAIKSIFFVIVFINCSYVPENIRPEVLTLDSIKNDKDVIVVGRIEMDPPFRKDDFFLKVSGLDLFSAKEFMQKVYRNKIHVHISDSDTEKKSERLRGGFDAYNKIDYSDKFIAPLSKVYYFKYTNKPLYFIDFGVLLSFFSDNRKYRNTTYKRAIFI